MLFKPKDLIRFHEDLNQYKFSWKGREVLNLFTYVNNPLREWNRNIILFE